MILMEIIILKDVGVFHKYTNFIHSFFTLNTYCLTIALSAKRIVLDFSTCH